MQRKSKILILISLLSFGSVAIALVSQYIFDMQPCAWCVLQRLLYLVIGAVALLCVIGQPMRVRLAVGISTIIVISIAGITAAIYQEKVAANTFSCAQSLADQIITKIGLDASAPWLFGIYASCMDARVKLLGIEYVWWSIAMFSLLGILGITALLKLRR